MCYDITDTNTETVSTSLLLSPGQWCGAKRVAVRKSSRSLLEYESWLKVGRDRDMADWREGRAAQRWRVRGSAADPLGLQQLSNSSENLTSGNCSMSIVPFGIVSKQLRGKDEKRPGISSHQSTLHGDVNLTCPATGVSSSTRKSRLNQDRNEVLPTPPKNLMSGAMSIRPLSVPGCAAIEYPSFNPANGQDQNRPTDSNGEKGIANSSSGSLAGMVGRGRKRLRLGS